jgi:hypothetical protein
MSQTLGEATDTIRMVIHAPDEWLSENFVHFSSNDCSLVFPGLTNWLISFFQFLARVLTFWNLWMLLLVDL